MMVMKVIVNNSDINNNDNDNDDNNDNNIHV